MDEMEEKLGAILNNPQMMQQIMSMAQAMGNSQSQPQSQPQPPAPQAPPMQLPDPAMLQGLSSLANQGNIDQDQRALLNALGPFISASRISRLERAMRAAKMAKIASTLMGQGGLSFLTGR